MATVSQIAGLNLAAISHISGIDIATLSGIITVPFPLADWVLVWHQNDEAISADMTYDAYLSSLSGGASPVNLLSWERTRYTGSLANVYNRFRTTYNEWGHYGVNTAHRHVGYRLAGNGQNLGFRYEARWRGNIRSGNGGSARHLILKNAADTQRLWIRMTEDVNASGAYQNGAGSLNLWLHDAVNGAYPTLVIVNGNNFTSLQAYEVRLEITEAGVLTFAIDDDVKYTEDISSWLDAGTTIVDLQTSGENVSPNTFGNNHNVGWQNERISLYMGPL